jgi:hypothetical protein
MVTAVAPVRPVPVIVTTCPPDRGPAWGLMPVTVGAARYVKRVFAAFVPLGVVTNTLAVPVDPAGVVAVMVVSFTTVTAVAALPPIVTPVAPVKAVPVIVTVVPPIGAPEAGLTVLTVGGAGGGPGAGHADRFRPGP